MLRLKPRQEYVDRYDRFTVEDCRWRENFHKNYKSKKPEENASMKLTAEAVGRVALYYDIFLTTLHWWEHKEKTVQKWMNEDAHRDNLLETARAPEGVRCLKCWTPLISESKNLYTIGEGGDRVLFFFVCPSGCLPHRMFFNNGEEYKPRRESCPKCQVDLMHTHEQITKEKITNTDTCPKCGYASTFEHELGAKKEKHDPDFEKDRIRFCLTEEQGRKALDERLSLEGMKRLVEKFKKRDEQKDEYEAVVKIKRLNVLALEKLLTPTLEKSGYVRLQLGTPEIGKDFFLPFTTYDDKPDRTERVSSANLSKILRSALVGTNWRLMSDGIFYRLGVLTGRLRAYEREEDLLELVKKP